jgi:hypothetical protein
VRNPQEVSGLVRSLDNVCHNRGYLRCFPSDKLPEICGPLNATFASHVNELTAAVNKGAALYGGGFYGFVKTHRDRACANQLEFVRREYNPFLDRCAQALAVQFPIPGDPDSNTCWDAPMRMSRVAHRDACEQALKRSDAEAIVARICRPPLGAPTTPMVCKQDDSGTCSSTRIRCQAPLPGGELWVAGGADLAVTSTNREGG